MQYSDSVYLSRFAVDPDSEYLGDDVTEDFTLFEAPSMGKLKNDIPLDINADIDVD